MKRPNRLFPLFCSRCALVVWLCLGLTVGARAQSPRDANAAPTATTASSAAHPDGDSAFIDGMIRDFQETYRLGPGDEIAVRIKGQPEYSLDRTKITPTGSIYHALLGDVRISGMTIEQSRDYLTKEFREYLKDPIVSVSLLDAVSAKFAVFGDVVHSGVFPMPRPMTIIDAIGAAGGFLITGSQDNVEIIRQAPGGTMVSRRVNVKLILKGKAKAEDNIALQPGDMVVVHGNFTKTLGKVTSLAGIGSLSTFMTLGTGIRR